MDMDVPNSSWPPLELPPNVSQLVQQYHGQLNEGHGTDEGRARARAIDLSIGKDDRHTLRIC